MMTYQKKHWVDGKMDEQREPNKTTKCCNFTLHDDDDLLQRRIGWLKNGWTESLYKTKKKL
jgi:hypothetical protein